MVPHDTLSSVGGVDLLNVPRIADILDGFVITDSYQRPSSTMRTCRIMQPIHQLRTVSALAMVVKVPLTQCPWIPILSDGTQQVLYLWQRGCHSLSKCLLNAGTSNDGRAGVSMGLSLCSTRAAFLSGCAGNGRGYLGDSTDRIGDFWQNS